MNEEEKETRSESNPKNGKKEKTLKKLLYLCLSFVGLFILSTILQETIEVYMGFSIWSFMSKSAAAIISLIGVGIEGVIALTTEEGRKAFSKVINRPADMTFGNHVCYLLKRAYVYVKRNTLVGLALIVIFFIFLPAYAASEGAGRKIFNSAQQVMNVVIPPKSFPNGGEDDSITTNPVTPNPEPDFSQLPQEETESPEGTDMVEGNAPSGRKKKTLIEQAKWLVLSDYMEYTISEEEFDKIFFQSGNYIIEDWNNKQKVESTVREFVHGQQIMRRNPSFDKDTPQSTLNNVDYASRVETEFLYEDVPTAQKLCYVINLRVEIYNSSPSYVLATLIRENFCCYGEAYRVQGKSWDIAAILYKRSILWGVEALQYETKEKNFRDDLDKLSERYSRLAMVLDAESDEYTYAKTLSEMFKLLANGL